MGHRMMWAGAAALLTFLLLSFVLSGVAAPSIAVLGTGHCGLKIIVLDKGGAVVEGGYSDGGSIGRWGYNVPLDISWGGHPVGKLEFNMDWRVEAEYVDLSSLITRLQLFQVIDSGQKKLADKTVTASPEHNVTFFSADPATLIDVTSLKPDDPFTLAFTFAVTFDAVTTDTSDPISTAVTGQALVGLYNDADEEMVVNVSQTAQAVTGTVAVDTTYPGTAPGETVPGAKYDKGLPGGTPGYANSILGVSAGDSIAVLGAIIVAIVVWVRKR